MKSLVSFFFFNNDKTVKIHFTVIFNHYLKKKNKLLVHRNIGNFETVLNVDDR